MLKHSANLTQTRLANEVTELLAPPNDFEEYFVLLLRLAQTFEIEAEYRKIRSRFAPVSNRCRVNQSFCQQVI